MSIATDRITKTPGVCGGDACIRGTRITVWGIASRQRLGATREEILLSILDLSEPDLDAALEYAAAHPDEIDQAIRDNEEGVIPEFTTEFSKSELNPHKRRPLNENVATRIGLILIQGFSLAASLFVSFVALFTMSMNDFRFSLAGNLIGLTLVLSPVSVLCLSVVAWWLYARGVSAAALIVSGLPLAVLIISVPAALVAR